MTYTLITFHFDRGELEPGSLSGLQAHLNALESQAACLAEGIYLLDTIRQPQHLALLEATERMCRQLGLRFLISTLDLDQPHRWDVPQSFLDTLDRWESQELDLEAL